jgi:hypothetical protein
MEIISAITIGTAFLGAAYVLPVIGVIFCLLVIGVLDEQRNGRSKKKWFGTFLMTVAFIGAFYLGLRESNATFSWRDGLTEVSKYLALGVIYSIVELYLEMRRSRKAISDHWETVMNKTRSITSDPKTGENIGYTETVTQRYVLSMAKEYQHPATAAMADIILDRAREYCPEGVVTLMKNPEDRFSLVPTLSKTKVLYSVGSWIYLWPFYFIASLLGDLLQNVIESVGRALHRVGTMIVKSMFKGVLDV